MLPKRSGARLNKEGRELHDSYEAHGYNGCICHLGHPPCSSCTDPGHPLSLEENEEYWEVDPETAGSSFMFDF